MVTHALGESEALLASDEARLAGLGEALAAAAEREDAVGALGQLGVDPSTGLEPVRSTLADARLTPTSPAVG